jgi:hypothetical protein
MSVFSGGTAAVDQNRSWQFFGEFDMPDHSWECLSGHTSNRAFTEVCRDCGASAPEATEPSVAVAPIGGGGASQKAQEEPSSEIHKREDLSSLNMLIFTVLFVLALLASGFVSLLNSLSRY